MFQPEASIQKNSANTATLSESTVQFHVDERAEGGELIMTSSRRQKQPEMSCF